MKKCFFLMGMLAFMLIFGMELAQATPGERYNQFTTSQRFSTFFINFFVPGIGSALVMDDTFGAVFQIVCATVGGNLLVTGLFFIPWLRWPFSDSWQISMRTVIAGGAVLGVSFVFNIIRSATFGRNVQTAHAPETWGIAFEPVADKNGINGFSLSYTMRF